MKFYSPGIRTKLISIFILIKVLPLIALAWFAWDESADLAARVEDNALKMVASTRKVVKGISELSTQNSIRALDDKSREAIERLTTDTAAAVASFLYDRDRDIQLAARLPRNAGQYRRFLASRYRPVVSHKEWVLNSDGERWVPENGIPASDADRKTVSARNDDNRTDFHYRPPDDTGVVENRPLFLEMTFVDTAGNEKLKVTTSDILRSTRVNVSDRRNTFCKAESYFGHLKQLQPGEIYVSEVIGAYVPGYIIGTYSKTRAEKMGIPFEPTESGYAGKENPVGRRFQGLVRWCTPVVENGRIAGYVTLALDHTHIMEFTDHIVPTEKRYSPISDAGTGNYAFMWDYKGRNISHPRDYFIVGFDAKTGERAVPWLDEALYARYQEYNSSMAEFEKTAPTFKEQTLSKKPAKALTRAGMVGLDGRYLNFAPQCSGWHNLTQFGGSGSFLIFWSGLWKLTTAAAIPYYTGIYGQSPRGFGYVTIGANVHEFHRPAMETAEKIQNIASRFETDLEKEKQHNQVLMRSTLQQTFRQLSYYTILMIVAVIFIAIFMAATLTNIITDMIRGIKRFQAGERSHRLKVRSGDEMGQLTAAFNDMADTVQQHIEDVEAGREKLQQMNERLKAEVQERQKAQEALARHRDTLELRVKERTAELEKEIEERRRMETRLHRAEKMEALGTLAGGVAHDLNNILSGIVTYPELLLMKLPQDNAMRKPIQTIAQSGKRAATIVQDLLTLARRGVAVTQTVNLNTVIRAHLESPEHQRLLSYHPDIRLETRLSDNLLNIAGSTVHLAKTLMNLISNAAEAMPEGGEIIISTENRYVDRPIAGYDDVEEGDYVTLTVTDTGVGICQEDMRRIFEPFYTKKKMGRSGTGLGMAVVWGTMKDHKGYIDSESIEGKGTRFTLYFPVTRAAVTESPSVPISEYRGKGEHILVVDDVYEQREIAAAILTELGYGVHTVSSGEEAIVYLKKNTADLIVLDMIMDPGIDGLDTYREIIALHPGQKAIIASGYSETDRIREAQRLGARQYLKKPYTIEKIARALKTALEEPAHSDA